MEPDEREDDALAGVLLPFSPRDRLAWEKALLQIRAHRRGNLIVRIVDQNGQPLRGVSVHYQQREQRFRLGMHYPYQRRVLDLLQGIGINAGTLWLGWHYLEPEQARWNWDYMEKVWRPRDLYNRGLQLHAHALLWFKPGWRVVPPYLTAASRTDLPRLVYEHVHYLVRRWGQWLDTYELVNEPFWREADLLALSLEEMVGLCHAAALAVRDLVPKARLEVNLAEVSRMYSYRISPLRFLDAMERANVPYDRIGLQALENSYSVTTPPVFYRSKTFTGILQVLRQYAGVGKPLHISALAVPSRSPGTVPSHWKPPYGPWDEIRQAHYLDAAYTLFYAQPEVEAITWWCPVDGRLALIPNGGLLRQDLSPKPAYRALQSWISRYTSSGTVETDDEGKAVITGYAGTYHVTFNLDGHAQEQVLPIAARLVHEHTERFVYIR